MLNHTCLVSCMLWCRHVQLSVHMHTPYHPHLSPSSLHQLTDSPTHQLPHTHQLPSIYIHIPVAGEEPPRGDRAHQPPQRGDRQQVLRLSTHSYAHVLAALLLRLSTHKRLAY